MKVILVVGARPNFMKVAPIIQAIREHQRRLGSNWRSDESIEYKLVHTGQHYDQRMSDSFFSDLGLPAPDEFLGVGSSSHAVQTADVMRHFEKTLMREQPDAVLVVGDVNSTLACAIVASKISYSSETRRPLIAHVESGLRSFDRAMPEEINRILTDHLADLLFVTEESGIQNLRNEGIPRERIFLVGNTMIDSLLAFSGQAAQSKILDDLGLGSNHGTPNGRVAVPYALLTLHRPSNVDDRGCFLRIVSGLDELAANCPILFPAHPRTQQRMREFGISAQRFCSKPGADSTGQVQNGFRLLEPQGYVDFLCLMKNASLVVTDSGGIQEETTCLGVPCVTVRENTERPVTITNGTNLLAGVESDKIRQAVRVQFARRFVGGSPEFWDGKAAQRIVEELVRATQAAGALAALRVA